MAQSKKPDYLIMLKENWLLLALPLLIIAQLAGAPSMLIFILALFSIVALASVMGHATEELAHHFGSTAGGFLNATFGNAAEFIIAYAAIRAGLLSLVKASLTGAIVGNILFVLGASILVGGFKFKEQKFNAKAAGLNSTMLLIAVGSLMIPSMFFFLEGSAPGHSLEFETEEISLLVSVVLIALYALSLVFSFFTHSYLFRSKPVGVPKGSRNSALPKLLLATIALAFASEVFTGQVEGIAKNFGFTEVFMGAVIVAVVGNAAEHLSAITAAGKNDMDLAISITVGSSIQIALFVAPVLVILSFIVGTPMNLVFTLFEIISLFAAVLIVNEISSDGATNWFEGAQLLGIYLIIAVLFFFVA